MKTTSLILACISLAFGPSSLSAQSKETIAGDGWKVSEPIALDAVRFKRGSEELSFKEVQEKWDEIGHEHILRQMGMIRHPVIVDFLYRVAIADPTLCRSRRQRLHVDGEFAIWNLTRTKHPLVAAKLEAILKAPMEGIAPESVRKVKGKAAQEILRFKDSNRALAYKQLDENARAGDVLCPYPPPGSFYRTDGTWIDPSVDAPGRALLQEWLSLEDNIARLEVAWCMAKAGVQDLRVREFAEIELSKKPEGKPSRAHFLAEQIISALAAHGDKRAERARDQLEMEKEIKRLSAGHPEGDRNIREHFEKEFRKKWSK